jgi:hypothetical protein
MTARPSPGLAHAHGEAARKTGVARDGGNGDAGSQTLALTLTLTQIFRAVAYEPERVGHSGVERRGGIARHRAGLGVPRAAWFVRRSEKCVRLAQKMQVGPYIAVGITNITC